jgi:CRISPR system Cascade subunit CasD
VRHLVFIIKAPMMAWGDIAYGRHRPTLSHPTRSGILGLVAGSLGYSRDADARHAALDASLGMATCAHDVGRPLQDYHTAQVPGQQRGRQWSTRRDELAESSVNTILSTRDYITDAVHSVALWTRKEGGPKLEEMAQALDSPVYAPYLGRRSCPPAWPFSPVVVDAVTLAEAFRQGVPPELRLVVGEREVYADADPAHPNAGFDMMTAFEQRDAPASRSLHLFAIRQVRSGWIGPARDG